MRYRNLCVSLPFSLIAFSGVLLGAPPPPLPHLVLQAGPEESVTSVAVSPDGSLVATGSFDGRVRVHDARTGALLSAIGSDVDRGGRVVVFAPDGQSLTCAGFHMDNLVRIYDIRTGRSVRTLAGHTEWEAYATAFSPDGKLLASAGTDKQILVWELATGTLRHRLEGQPFPVTALAFSPDGATLASGGGEKTIRLWGSKSGRLLRTLAGHRDWVSTLAYSPDGKTIASGSCDWAYHRGRDASRFEGRDPGAESEWKLWDADTGALKRAGNEAGRLLSLAFAPDGKSLACGAGKDVRLYDLQTEDPGRVVTSHDGAITSVAFVPDGGALISGSHDRTVRRVALASGKVEWRVPGYWEQVNSVALSSDGSLIATGSSDLRFAGRTPGTEARQFGPGAVRLWEARSGRLVRRLGDPAEQVMAVALSPDGRLVAGGGGSAEGSGLVRIWDTATGAPAWSNRDHSATVLAVAFAPDGSSLASTGADGVIKLRDPKTGSLVRTIPGHEGGTTSVVFSADGGALVSGGVDGAVSLWDVRTGRPIRTFPPPGLLARILTGGARYVTSAALSRDGRTLATCSARVDPSFGDQVVRVWDARTGELIRELSSSQTRGRFVLLSPDGTTLATNGLGKSIALWDLRTGELLRKLEGHDHPPQSAAFSADGRLLVSGGDFRTTKVWEVASGRLLATLVTFAESRPGTTDDWLAYRPDGFYEGSPDVDRFLAWRVGDELKKPDSLGSQLHRPDRVESALTLAPADPDAP
jgi:WD40 repeat protein